MDIKKGVGIFIFLSLFIVGVAGLISAEETEEGDITAPICSVNFLEHELSGNTYDLESSIYIPEDGEFFVSGVCTDTESNIANIQYNRVSSDTGHDWTDADEVDGLFNSLEESWRSDPNDDSYIEGVHTICARGIDDLGNTGTEEDSCQTFCVDTQDPNQVMNVIHENPSECVSEYVNEAPKWTWDQTGDNGCAETDHYEIELYFSDGTLVDDFDVTEGTSFTVPNPENGEDYYIRVRAIDQADNEGEWSNTADPQDHTHIFYDDEDPSVTINGDAWDIWYNDDFNVDGTDTDNLGLFKCEIGVDNDGDGSFDGEYIEVNCNELETIDISEVCPEDGLNDCWVRKRVTDNACNMDIEGHKWDLDRENPETTKIVSEPKYPGFQWMGWLVDWFVTDETTITLSCDDNELSECDETFYRIKFNNGTWGNWTEYEDPFNLDEGDGIYELEYYSVDNLGNTEETQSETDKVDTEPPTSTKTIGDSQFIGNRIIQGVNFLLHYITSSTPITIEAFDSESGVNQIWWTLLVNETDGPITEAYLNNTIYEEWQEPYQNCVNGAGENWKEVCNITNWRVKNEYFQNGFEECETEFNFETPWNWWGATWCPVQGEPISINQDSNHKICQFSVDNVGNIEELQCQVVSVDNQAPIITIHNPTQNEADNVERCAQSIVVEAFDEKAGINESTIIVQLWNSDGEKVREVPLEASDYETYEGLMNKELPVGDYTLRVIAEDNLGNLHEKNMSEFLNESVFVEFITPVECNINPEIGGSCDFSFNICMRGGNSVQFWMNKLGDVVTPGMMDATISGNGNETFVGLKHEGFQSDGGVLNLNCDEINGKTQFDLHLDLDSNVTSQIGPGVHELEYIINSSIQICNT